MNLVKEKNMNEIKKNDSNDETINEELKKKFLEYYNDRLKEILIKIKKYNKIKRKIESQLIEINNNKLTKECKAINNYALFNNIDIKNVNIIKLHRSSAGIKGWSNYKHNNELQDMEELRI